MQFLNNKIAVTHDWLLEYAGAERVLEQILKVLGSDIDIFTTVYNGEDLPFLENHQVNESFISKLPFGRSKYRNYLPLMPLAVEQWDMSDYDIVVSSSYAVAKGFLSHPDQLHISYVHSPIRYAWDLQHQYLRESGLDTGLKGWLAKYMLHRIRQWDVRTANQVDHFIANSEFIQRRIQKTYRRESTVIYPPVNVDAFEFRKDKEDFYCTVCRLVPYKKVSLIIEAFNKMPDKHLKVIGGGPDLEKMKQLAGPNIEVLGFQPQEKLTEYMSAAKAFVYAAKEDFGIVPVEAQACGTPVIAYGRGGLAETVKPYRKDKKSATGILFYKQEVKSIIDSVNFFESHEVEFTPQLIRGNAEKFKPERFRTEISDFIEKGWNNFRKALSNT